MEYRESITEKELLEAIKKKKRLTEKDIDYFINEAKQELYINPKDTKYILEEIKHYQKLKSTIKKRAKKEFK